MRGCLASLYDFNNIGNRLRKTHPKLKQTETPFFGSSAFLSEFIFAFFWQISHCLV